jgi:hypothetical protein
MIDNIFDWCVDLLILWAEFFSITYNEINIIIFVIGYPIVLVGVLIMYIKYRRRYTKLIREITKNLTNGTR